MLAELLVFQMCAICIGYDGHICPFVDGVEQFWNCDEQWTIMYMPRVMTWYSTDLKEMVAGEWFVDMYGVPTAIIGGSPVRDDTGLGVLGHELRHLQCLCDWHG